MHFRPSVGFLSALAAAVSGFAQNTMPLELPLWDKPQPNFVADANPGADDGTGRFWKVGVPGMLVYRPEKPNGLVIVVCPGGGYTHLTRLVGADGAVNAFLPKGVTIVALRYRTAPPSINVDDDALADGKRALRLIRHHAKDWGIDPRKVGLLGWSAGANLVLNVATHFDAGNVHAVDPVERESSRPDFVVLLSPWPAKQTIGAYPVSADAPPAFVGSARDDKTAPVAFAESIASGYRTAHAPVSLWVVETGGHGAFTIDVAGEGGKWIDRFWPWLDSIDISRR
jgi:acetyl esterase/lipase